MNFSQLIKIANRNLLRAKLRTFLTIAAIFIGSFTLTLTNGLGGGLRDYVNNQVKNIEGGNVLFVRKKPIVRDEDNSKPGEPREYQETVTDAAGNQVEADSPFVPIAQAENLARELPEVKQLTPSYAIDGEYITIDGAKKYRVGLGMLSTGVRQKTEAGRTIDGANQIMLPVSLAKAFDENVNRLVGKTATIGYKTEANAPIRTVSLEIVGVSTKGMMANYNSFVDPQTARRIYDEQQTGKENYNRFFAYTFLLNSGDAGQISDTKKKLDERGFAAETFADREKRTYDAIGILQIGLNLFASIALLAASFGIINTLVIAVLERTKEVGLQKALGMGRWRIFLLFSLESVLIGFWGAIIGIVAGIVAGKLANLILAKTYLESFEGYTIFVFTIPAILFVLLLVCAIAFLAGVLPALRASRLNPIEALRYE